jgi:hypothetical protein
VKIEEILEATAGEEGCDCLPVKLIVAAIFIPIMIACWVMEETLGDPFDEGDHK